MEKPLKKRGTTKNSKQETRGLLLFIYFIFLPLSAVHAAVQGEVAKLQSVYSVTIILV